MIIFNISIKVHHWVLCKCGGVEIGHVTPSWVRRRIIIWLLLEVIFQVDAIEFTETGIEIVWVLLKKYFSGQVVLVVRLWVDAIFLIRLLDLLLYQAKEDLKQAPQLDV